MPRSPPSLSWPAAPTCRACWLATDRFDGSLARSLRHTPRLRNQGSGETLLFLVGQGLVSQSELACFPRPDPAEFVNVLTPTLDRVLIGDERETCEPVSLIGDRTREIVVSWPGAQAAF